MLPGSDGGEGQMSTTQMAESPIVLRDLTAPGTFQGQRGQRWVHHSGQRAVSSFDIRGGQYVWDNPVSPWIPTTVRREKETLMRDRGKTFPFTWLFVDPVSVAYKLSVFDRLPTIMVNIYYC